PPNISCFLLLKRAYSCKVESLIYYYINHITKLKFLLAFKAAFTQLFMLDNICLAFRGAGLQIAREQRQGGDQSGLSRQALARCRRCRETGHNSRTCKVDT
ncbi:uncharacterized protein M421DRAFT_425083, partial [Didymella exigua CBS 183.55]